MDSYLQNVELTLSECRKALEAVSSEETDRLIELLLKADQVFLIGVGRVMLSLQSFAKRLAHLGIKTHLVGEITEPALKPGDVLIVGSGSGESLFPKVIAEKAKKLGAIVVMIGSNRSSTIASLADLMIRVPTNTKMKCPDEIPSEQIMTSLFEQFLLLYGDIVTRMIAQKEQLVLEDLWEYHANLE